MLFSSIVFLFYFLPIVLIVYFLLSFSRFLQNSWLLIVSLIFYAWGEPKNIVIMIGSILFNSVFGLLIEKNRKRKDICKLFLIIAIVLNVSILFVYKYLNFFIENINISQGKEILPILNLSLPIGISFFTFQALSYVIDVYKGKTKAEKNIFKVGLYISFFPQLIAGPIVQYNDIAEQLGNRKVTFRKLSIGCCRFVAGLAKKIILANSMAGLAENIFSWSSIGTHSYVVPSSLAWIGAIAYAFQIYFDFSAYSDMAIGLGLMFGFKFKENFNFPYVSKSISEFWRRWHISLTDWFKEYVYFPLGGSRVKNKDHLARNLLIVWVLTGLWHGAEWTFLVWGVWNFVFILFEKFTKFHLKLEKIPIFSHLYVVFVFVIGWVIFRANDLYQAGLMIMNMFMLNKNGFYSNMVPIILKEYAFIFLMCFVFATPITRKTNEYLMYKKIDGKNSVVYTVFYPVVMMMLFAISVSYLATGSYNPFIYFNF